MRGRKGFVPSRYFSPSIAVLNSRGQIWAKGELEPARAQLTLYKGSRIYPDSGSSSHDTQTV